MQDQGERASHTCREQDCGLRSRGTARGGGAGPALHALRAARERAPGTVGTGRGHRTAGTAGRTPHKPSTCGRLSMRLPASSAYLRFLSVHLPVHLSVHPTTCPCDTLYLSRLSTTCHLSVCLTHLCPVYPSCVHPVCPSCVCSLYQSIHLPICLSVCLSVSFICSYLSVLYASYHMRMLFISLSICLINLSQISLCPPLHLSTHPSVHPAVSTHHVTSPASICPAACLYVCLSIYLYLSISPSLHLPYQCIPDFSLSVCPSAHPSIRPPNSASICPVTHITSYLSICPSIHPPIHPSF